MAIDDDVSGDEAFLPPEIDKPIASLRRKTGITSDKEVIDRALRLHGRVSRGEVPLSRKSQQTR